MTRMTNESIGTSQILSLRDEASAAGDVAQVALCDLAVNGDPEARIECERVIRDARSNLGGES